MDKNKNTCTPGNKDESKPVVLDDKYKGKPLRFQDCGNHYEMIFADSFAMPDKDNTVATDLMMDLKDADKDKELHIYINSHGGEVACLSMLIQHVLEFRHCVTITAGSAMSAGFLLFCCGKERYTSPFCEMMYHAVSSYAVYKAKEIADFGRYMEKLDKLIMHHTNVRELLTDDEMERGRTTEVWLMGADLIDRGVVSDYKLFKSRTPVGSEEFMTKNGRYFKKDGDLFLEYAKTDNKLKYIDLINLKDGDKPK